MSIPSTSSARLRVAQPGAGVEVGYLSPAPLAFAQTNGFIPPPSREFPNIWHLETGTTEVRRELGMITVLMPQRAGPTPAWSAKRTDDSTGAAVEITVGGKRHTIRFPAPGGDAPVQVTLPAI